MRERAGSQHWPILQNQTQRSNMRMHTMQGRQDSQQLDRKTLPHPAELELPAAVCLSPENASSCAGAAAASHVPTAKGVSWGPAGKNPPTEHKTNWKLQGAKETREAFVIPEQSEGGGQPQSPTYLQRLCVQFLPL